MEEYAVEFENLTFRYEESDILRGISEKLSAGGIYALFGPNGSGKSTLLKCLAGLLKPQQGDVFIFGKNRKSTSPHEMSHLLAYVPQEHQLSFPFSVREIVLMGRTPYLGGVKGPAVLDIESAEHALELVGIADLAARPYTHLSGGQRQLVMIARAIAQDTSLMILDEPTSALDFKNQIAVWRILAMLKAKGKTVIVCTHDPNHVLWFCDQVLVLKDGSILRSGAVSKNIDTALLKALYGDICEITGNVVRPQNAV